MAKGKALYQPEGKAQEYNRWAANFYTGCSHNCDYCYLKRGSLAATWDTVPHLKKCFKSEAEAYLVFKKELLDNRLRVRAEGGVFFSFSTDPCIEPCFFLTRRAALLCFDCDVPVTILTKNVGWLNATHGSLQESDLFGDKDERDILNPAVNRGLLAVGFTLTGHDEMERGAHTNESRIKAMAYLKGYGVRTFASVEPVIDTKASLKMVEQAAPFCDLFKIGLRSGVTKDYYDKKLEDGDDFISLEQFMAKASNIILDAKKKVYWKESLRCKLFAKKFLDAPISVSSTYNLFNR